MLLEDCGCIHFFERGSLGNFKGLSLHTTQKEYSKFLNLTKSLDTIYPKYDIENVNSLCMCTSVVPPESVRYNSPTANATSADIQREVAHYLKGSADRDGGRKARHD